MRLTLTIACTFFLFLSTSNVWGQQPRNCGTDAHLQQQEATDPGAQARRAAYEARLQDWIATHPEARTANATYIIPTVVHLIQESATPVVTDACVQSQIDVLNEDFQALNADTSVIPAEFQSILGNTSVEFCLATIDPQGNPTNGIVRVINATHANHSMGNSSAMKALSQWDPHKYFNIWVPQTINGGVLGYATFPSSLSSNPAEDGIVVAGNYFGRGGCAATPYHLGRTATHEAGHWLGLYHTFDGGCAGNDAASCATAGDRVCDTPPTAGSNFGCPATQNTCTETPFDHNDNTHNFMDYGDDNCIVMFTEGQVGRMHAAFGLERTQLVSQANHTATGCGCSPQTPCAPRSSFAADNIVICPGQTVNFTDLSTGPATSWLWSFQGGSPFASTIANPSVTYTNPGTYDVTLEVTNSMGTNSVTISGYITVTLAAPPPVAEGFEANLPSDWQIYNEDNSGTWVVTDTASSLGLKSIYMNNWGYDALGTRDAVLTRTIDLSSFASGEMTFDRAYKRAPFINDTLTVYVSTDCGETWTSVWEKWDAGLATVTGIGISNGFVPVNPTEWNTDTLDLVPYLGTDGFKVKFETRAHGGQNLFLDNINLLGVVGKPDPAQQVRWTFDVAPNPFKEGVEIAWTLPQKTVMQFSLVDVQGREVYRSAVLNGVPGRNTLALPIGLELPAGMYILRGESAWGTVARKVVKM